MRGTVTYDNGTDRTVLETVYDRLRKRSLRRMRRLWPVGYVAAARHSAYIQGVKDALNAIREENL